MKGLNIKKIAAIGLGAALIGSAIAPIVSATQVSNVADLEKGDVVDSTGTPVVDVVVGSGAAVSDVVWAGNIAARVAQLATVSAAASCEGGAATDGAVTVTVGGEVSTAGEGTTDENNVTFGSGVGSEFAAMSVDDSEYPGLVNDSSWEYENFLKIWR